MIKSYKYFLFSENPDKLVKFYTDALGMNITRKLEYDLDYGYTLEVCEGGQQIWLAKHSEVKDVNKDPYRIMLNMYVDSVQEYYEKAMKYNGTTSIAEPFNMGEIVPGEERWVCTVLDPDGNCLQFMGNLK